VETDLHHSIQQAVEQAETVNYGTARTLNAMVETAMKLQSQLDGFPFFGAWRVVLQPCGPSQQLQDNLADLFPQV
jgi:hypothetical protein